jgi:hypothetical protein
MRIFFEIYLKVCWGQHVYCSGCLDCALNVLPRWGAHRDVFVERRLEIDLEAFVNAQPPLPSVPGRPDLVELV